MFIMGLVAMEYNSVHTVYSMIVRYCMHQLANSLGSFPGFPLAFILPAVEKSTTGEIKARGKPGNEATNSLHGVTQSWLHGYQPSMMFKYQQN